MNIQVMKPDRVDNELLRDAGLELMRVIGNPLTKSPSRGRAMLYEMPNGQTVRIRTCNDHILVVVADAPTIDARLNIQGTDWLLIVMPEIERAVGKVIAYLVPAEVAEEAVRESHQAWLSSNPNTRGHNTTWNLRFGHFPSGMTGRKGKQGYHEKWSRYRLEGDVSTEDVAGAHSRRAGEPGNILTEVEDARQRIARAASVPVEAVKVSIDF